MANYTQSIREILQANKGPLESLTNISDVEAIARRTIFNVDGIESINEDFRPQLIIGFSLHFMNDEIGYETLPLWKIALNEKLYNSGSYINKIFENLDKEVFADYSVRNVLNSGNTSDSKSFAGTVTHDNSSTTSTTDDNETTVTKVGAELNLKQGEDSLKKIGSEAHQRGGKDVLKKEGSEYQLNDGNDETSDVTFQDNARSSATDVYTNGIQMQSDTPMGSLENLVDSPEVVDHGVAVGTKSIAQNDPETGINYRRMDVYGLSGGSQQGEEGSEAGQGYTIGKEYNYMSAAAENDETQTTIENGNEQSFNRNASNTQYGHGVATTYGIKGYEPAEEGQEPEPIPDDRLDTNSYGSLDSTTYGYKIEVDGVTGEASLVPDEDGREDKNEYNSGSSTLYGKYYDGNSIKDSERKDTTTENASHESTVTDNGSQMTSNIETDTGTHADTTIETDHRLNWEMLYKSMPLLNKVWEIFDDLFMLIY